jgi:hypothetical protein
MTTLSHKARAERRSARFPGVSHIETLHQLDGGQVQSAQGSDDLAHDDMLRLVASGFQWHLLGAKVEAKTVSDALDGAGTVDIELGRKARFDQSRARRDNPRTHDATPRLYKTSRGCAYKMRTSTLSQCESVLLWKAGRLTTPTNFSLVANPRESTALDTRYSCAADPRHRLAPGGSRARGEASSHHSTMPSADATTTTPAGIVSATINPTSACESGFQFKTCSSLFCNAYGVSTCPNRARPRWCRQQKSTEVYRSAGSKLPDACSATLRASFGASLTQQSQLSPVQVTAPRAIISMARSRRLRSSLRRSLWRSQNEVDPCGASHAPVGAGNISQASKAAARASMNSGQSRALSGRPSLPTPFNSADSKTPWPLSMACASGDCRPAQSISIRQRIDLGSGVGPDAPNPRESHLRGVTARRDGNQFRYPKRESASCGRLIAGHGLMGTPNVSGVSSAVLLTDADPDAVKGANELQRLHCPAFFISASAETRGYSAHQAGEKNPVARITTGRAEILPAVGVAPGPRETNSASPVADLKSVSAIIGFQKDRLRSFGAYAVQGVQGDHDCAHQLSSCPSCPHSIECWLQAGGCPFKTGVGE